MLDQMTDLQPPQDTSLKEGKGSQSAIPLQHISDYPLLSKCLAIWQAARVDDTIPRALPLEELPDELMQYSMLLEHLPDHQDAQVLTVGTFIAQHPAFDAEGLTLRGFFDEAGADTVYTTLRSVAENKSPDLARRENVAVAGTTLSYVRLILPLSSDGNAVTGFFKTIEPGSLRFGDPDDKTAAETFARLAI